MVKNKKLFVVTILLGVISLVSIVFLFFSYETIDYKTIGAFFVSVSIVGGIIYTLLLISLERKILIKRIYYFCMFFAMIIFILGLMLFILY